MSANKKNQISEILIANLDRLVVGVIASAVTLGILQFNVASNTRDIATIKADYVLKAVLEEQLSSIESQLSAIKQAADKTNEKLDRLIEAR